MGDTCRAIRHCLLLPAASLRDHVFNLGGLWSPTIFEAATFVADRFEKLGRKRPAITRVPVAPGEKSEPMDYRIDLLKSTGFVSAMDSTEELDDLIAFCEREFGC
jgi:hypothetical protein